MKTEKEIRKKLKRNTSFEKDWEAYNEALRWVLEDEEM